MGRPRKPAAVLEMTGSFDRNPNRRREDPAMPSGGLGPAPEKWVSKAATGSPMNASYVQLWEELKQQDVLGLLGPADRWFAEDLVELMYKLRAGLLKGSERTLLNSKLASIGFTPAGRTKFAELAPRKPLAPDASNAFGRYASRRA